MVGTDKVKGFALTIQLAVDSPNTSAVGQRFSSGYRVSTSTRSTAHYRFALDQIYLTGVRQHELGGPQRTTFKSREGAPSSSGAGEGSAGPEVVSELYRPSPLKYAWRS